MAELIGENAVKQFIRNSHCNYWRIWKQGESHKMPPVAVSDSGNGEEDFSNFAALYANSPESYSIRCYDDPSEDDEARTTKKRKVVKTTFSLMERKAIVSSSTPLGERGLSKAEIISIIKETQTPQVDISQAISAAIEKTAHKYQMDFLTARLEEMEKNHAKENAALRQMLMDKMEEEEEEERIEKEESALVEAKKIEMEGYKHLANMGSQVLGQVKEVVYELWGPGKKVNGAQLRAVAGPSISEKTVVGFELPEDKATPGKFPLFAPSPADNASEEEKKAFAQDQQLKLQEYATKLYRESNDQMGDDMALLYKMWKDMPSKYEEMIIKLRQTFGYNV